MPSVVPGVRHITVNGTWSDYQRLLPGQGEVTHPHHIDLTAMPHEPSARRCREGAEPWVPKSISQGHSKKILSLEPSIHCPLALYQGQKKLD